MFAYLRNIREVCSDRNDQVLVMAQTESLLRNTGFFFPTRTDGYYSHNVGYLLFDSPEGGFIFSFTTWVLADVRAMNQYDVI